jgi:putative sterol carrier protein
MMEKPPVKEYFEKVLPTLFVPEQAKGWDRIIQYHLKEGEFTVEIKDQKLTVAEGVHPNPQIEIWSDYDTLWGIQTGKIFPPMAVIKKKMKASGPLSDQMKIGRVFKTIK